MWMKSECWKFCNNFAHGITCWRKISDKSVANVVMNYELKVNLECVKLNQRINEAHSYDHWESDQLIENSIWINWLNGGNFGVVYFSLCVCSLCSCLYQCENLNILLVLFRFTHSHAYFIFNLSVCTESSCHLTFLFCGRFLCCMQKPNTKPSQT